MAKNVRLDDRGFRKFGTRDKLAYAAGDFGCNMSFALKGTMSLFWTQFMGIKETHMAMLLILVQVWDAINDPVIGAMVDADKHQYKRNKFLQYIWVGSVGLVVAGALCFIPWKSAPYAVKMILYVVGYVFWDAFYTIANVPYGSMLSLISDVPEDRAQLSTWRSVGSMLGNLLTASLIPMLIFDAGNNLRGELLFAIALIMGVIGYFSFQFMIKNTEVRVQRETTLSEEKFNVGKAMSHFLRNRAALGATLAVVGMFIGMSGAQVVTTVVFQSYFHNAQISGALSMLSMVGIFLWVPFIGKATKKYGKKELIVMGNVIMVIAYVLMLVLPMSPDGKGIAVYAACSLLASVGMGVGSCLSWSLMADAMDYEEWKFGVRNEGTTYALHSFFRKLAQGVGPALGLAIASSIGYVAVLGPNQNPGVPLKLRYMLALSYLVGAVFQLVSYAWVYNLDKKTMATITSELEARNAK